MKNTWRIRVVSFAILLTMILPTGLAFADVVSSGGRYVPIYNTMDTADPVGGASAYSVTVSEQTATLQSGWYLVNTSFGQKYVRASDMTVSSADPTPTPTPTPNPNATPSPTPGITGEKDTTYTGEILNYTVPAGGLWLYDKVDGKTVESLAAYSKVSLTAVENSSPKWYSIYYKSKTYYVPESILWIDTSSNANNVTGTASIVLGANGATLYTTPVGLVAPADPAHVTDVANLAKYVTGNTLSAGVRVNAKYYNANWYSYVMGTSTYYILARDVKGGSNSSAAVGSNTDTTLMRTVPVSSSTKLYRVKDARSANYILVSALGGSVTSLYGVKVDDEWYKVMYGDEVFYARVSADNGVDGGLTSAEIAGITTSAVVETATTSTYWATVGANGAYYYSTRSRNTTSPATGSVGQLSAGSTILVSPYDSLWYTYSLGGMLYYVYAADLGTSTATTQMSGTKMYLLSSTALYDRMLSSALTSQKLPKDDYYVVQTINNDWYSINYDGTLYYIKRDDSSTKTLGYIEVGSNRNLYEYNAGQAPPYGTTANVSGSSEHLPIVRYIGPNDVLNNSIPPTSTDGLTVSSWYAIVMYQGKEYLLPRTVELNDEGADWSQYFSAVDGSQPIANTAEGKSYYITVGVSGAILYTDSGCTNAAANLAPGEIVYATKYTDTLYMVSVGGAKYYLPLRYITSIKGGDDASAQTSTGNTGTSIGTVLAGEKDSTFESVVFAYTIPAGGLWLYYNANSSSQRINLNAGTIRLSEIQGGGWYTTYYAGRQYYVPAAALTTNEAYAALSTMVSVQLSGGATSLSLYTSTAFTATGAITITVPSGARINVRIAAKSSSGTVTAYSYVHTDGKTYYIKRDDVQNSLTATVDSNANTTFLTKFVFDTSLGFTNVKLYAEPKTTSTYIQPSFATTPLELYGVKESAGWYAVVYNNATWYLDVQTAGSAGAAALANSQQLSVTSGTTAATTYTVVIGQSGAKLYKQPIATTVNESGMTLAAGQRVQAGRRDSTWYTVSDDTTGVTYYFLASAIAGTTTNDTVSSYIITIPTGVNIDLYATVSKTANKINSLQLTAGNTYTLRKLNADWSSTVIKGTTYYVKNEDIPRMALDQSTPIASTTVGKTYTITLGAGGADVFGDSKLTTSNKKGTLSGGYTTTGTKMYVANASSAASVGMVYAITFGGSTAYISADDVASVALGDEYYEALEAAQNATQSGTVAVGTKVVKTLEVGDKIYVGQSTSGGFIELPWAITVDLTKLNADWYQVDFSGSTYYYPASKMETSTGSTSTTVTVSVGESYTLTFTQSALVYPSPIDGVGANDAILAGETHLITRISDAWYEVTIDGIKRYLKYSEVVLPTIAQTNTGKTHDGTGYITPYLKVTLVSGTLNLRKTASTTGTILDRIPNGTQVANLKYVVDSSKRVWYNVTYNGKTGYILGDYVQPVGTVADDSSTTSYDPSSDIGKSLAVNTANVNVRSGAGTKYSIVGRLDKGTMVTPLQYSTGDDNLTWYKFQYSSSQAAWIRADYLTGSAVSRMEQSGNVAIKQGDTNLRSGAGNSFSVVTKLARDTIVTIVGKGTDSSDNLWYNVKKDNMSGYVLAELVRPLTAAEQSSLQASAAQQYTELKSGSKGAEVVALQQQLILLGYLPAGSADGSYGPKTTAAVKAFQAAKGLSQTGVASQATQAMLFGTNTSSTGTGSTMALDWFSTGFALINANKNVTIYDTRAGITWSARYINGDNHADVIPASKADAQKILAANITGSYIRRPVIVTIAGTRYAGSMYAVGHGTTSYCDYFSGVMCIHFTGSKTHGTNNVDSDHQAAIQEALNSGL